MYIILTRLKVKLKLKLRSNLKKVLIFQIKKKYLFNILMRRECISCEIVFVDTHL